MEESRYYQGLWAQESSNFLAGALNTFYQLYMAGINVSEIYVHLCLLSVFIFLSHTAIFPVVININIIDLVTETVN